MIENYKYKFIRFLTWLNIINYCTFITIDFFNKSNLWRCSNLLKYIGILICFIITLLIGEDKYDSLDKNLVRIALLFTIIADFNFLIINNYVLGILFFCLVQFTYIIRHNRGKNIKTYNYFFILMIYIILFLLLNYINLFHDNNFIISISLVYGLILIHSLIISLGTFKRKFFSKKTCILIILGLILFLFCDVNVALYNIDDYLVLKYNGFENISNSLIWIFYLPSQIFLSLSGYNNVNKIFRR
ncbi:hypothetical protein [Clostridium niameyense]|uniref:hypothetical protein n=1 Tax=Clostridium niameyense TaxID=1622073 RepID=UPI00067F1841|nr:hypothetical protein [Clostridium niameyense]